MVNPLPHEKELTEIAKATRRRSEAQASERASEKQWEMCSMAIKAFMDKYPKHMQMFLQDLQGGRTKYNEALPEHKDLKKAQWRNTASFPVIYKKLENGEIKEVDSLLPTLKKIIPGLTNKKSKNYVEFLKRYPIFLPSDKSNAGEF